jgi:ABC-type transport system involved in multi-copper enzyme maturation permease subunit
VFAATTWATAVALQSAEPTAYGATLSAAAQAVIPLIVLGLVLINALAVTSITNERDVKALDLLLVTDLTPKEIVFGKLGGILFNAKEMILLPAVLCVGCWWFGGLSGENLVFVMLSLLVVIAFVMMLGVHSGMAYANSRTAVGVSIGTLLFLLLGIAVCMRMMVAFQSNFNYQLQAFMAFMVGGGIGLFVALGARNPSGAIFWASFVAPWATFYVITSFLQTNYGAAALITVAIYGFATASLLIPALYEFDVATGRTAARDA